MTSASTTNKFDDIDLSDRRGLIAMTEIYAKGGPNGYNNQAFINNEAGGAAYTRGGDITKILYDPHAAQQQTPPDTAPSTSSPLRSPPRKTGGSSTMTAISSSSPAAVKFPHTEGKKRMSVSKRNILLLLLLIGLLFFAAIVLTYFLTKNMIEGRYEAAGGVPHDIDGFGPGANDTLWPSGSEEDGETDGKEGEGNADFAAPTAAELRLARSLWPLWYNLTMRVYVPGYAAFPEDRELTFSAALIIKFIAKEAASSIELNSLELGLPNDTDSYQILIDGAPDSAPAKNSTVDAEDESPQAESSLESSSSSPSSESDDEEHASGNASRRKRQNHLRRPSGISVTSITVNKTLEKVIFEVDPPFEAGKEYYLQFRYTGPIRTKLSGLYLTTYNDTLGKTHYSALTQFEATDARRMVPCFDEPEYKAIWRLRIHHPVGSKAISNAKEIIEDEPDSKFPDFVYTTFDETPVMSSYLLAIVVSNFEFTEGETKRGTRFRVWARADAVSMTDYALQAGTKVLEFFEDYYGINFPLQKQDMVALPDFAAGAMENWGLITYRERALLYNDRLFPPTAKQYVGTVVAHELAHQWFGNLVTMKWWNDLWLNEGFATLMEYLGVDVLDPSYDMDKFFLVSDLHQAFTRDAMATSHPLSFPINKAEDVKEAFDVISYSKGASVLRMIRAILGEENFRNGLHIYLTKHSYANAEHEDLWAALMEVVPSNVTAWNEEKFDVDDFAKKWTEQMGYPVVIVETTPTGLALSQKRFKVNENAPENPRFKEAKYWYKWDVPIWHTVDGESQPLKWLHSELELPLPSADSLVFVNSESIGYYRVKYDAAQMAKINHQLEVDNTKIDVRSRVRYISDVFALAEAGQLDYTAALDVTRYVGQEEHVVPLSVILESLRHLDVYIGDEIDIEEVRTFIKRSFQAGYDRVVDDVFGGNDTSDFLTGQLHTTYVEAMCGAKHQDCLDRALKAYREQFVAECTGNLLSSNCSTVPVAIRPTVYCSGVKYGDDRDWQRILELFQRELVQIEKDRLMQALACSRDPLTLKKLLIMASDINNTVIRLQDKSTLFSQISYNLVGDTLAFEYFMQHWDQLYDSLRDQTNVLKRFIHAAFNGKTPNRLKELKEFLKANQATTRALDVFQQQLEVVQNNVQWMSKNYDNVVGWFRTVNQAAEPIPLRRTDL